MLSANQIIFNLIDVQEKLFNVMENKEELNKNLVRLVKGLRTLEIPVIWMEQYPQGLGPTVPFLKELLSAHKPLEKVSFSSMSNSGFQTQLLSSKRKQVIVAGIETHVCVYQTVRELIDSKFETYVVADACSSRTNQNHNRGLHILETLGARITTTEMLLFELIRSAEHPNFRQISRIIK